MSLESRLELYRDLEGCRGRPLIAYVTSDRRGFYAAGVIGADAIGELRRQLHALPAGADALDLLIISQGGDPMVAWRIVSLIRERVPRFSVLVPEAAFSAATLIALGANEIVMHPDGNLGPVDPQIPASKERERGASQESSFGSEDLAAFLTFARKQVGLTDQAHILDVFKLFCADVGSTQIGVAARSAQLMMSLGEQLLKLHMVGKGESQKARAIAGALSKKFYHHGYPLSRKEARQIGLKVEEPSAEVEDLLWRLWLDIAEEMELREPFSPLTVIARNPACAALFAPTPQLNIPTNIPPQLAQQVLQAVLQQAQVVAVPPTPYTVINALLESPRFASRFVTEGRIFASRLPDLRIQPQLTQERACWRTMPLPPHGAAGGHS